MFLTVTECKVTLLIADGCLVIKLSFKDMPKDAEVSGITPVVCTGLGRMRWLCRKNV